MESPLNYNEFLEQIGILCADFGIDGEDHSVSEFVDFELDDEYFSAVKPEWICGIIKAFDWNQNIFVMDGNFTTAFRIVMEINFRLCKNLKY